MATLQIHLPERAPEQAHEYRWVLHDGTAALTHGVSVLGALPRADACDLVAPAARVLFATVRMPQARGKTFAQMLPYAVEDLILGEPDTVHVAAGNRNSDGKVTVAIVDKAWLAKVIGDVEQAGLEPHTLVSEVVLAPFVPDTWSVIWDGERGYVRTSSESGFAIDGLDQGAPPLALQLAVQEAVKPPHRITLHLGPQVADLDVAAWANRLAIPITRGADWIWPSAARLNGGAINLLQGEYAPSGPSRTWTTRARPAVILAGIVALVHGGATVTDWWMLTRERDQLQASITSAFRQAFPEAKIVDAPLQMKRNLAELRRARGAGDATDFLPLLAASAPGLSASGSKLQRVQYQRGRLQADLVMADRTSAEALRARLQAAGLPARLESVQPAGTAVEVRIVIGGPPS